MRKIIREAVRDLYAGWNLRALWISLALEDVKDSYRHTILGFFWLVFSFAVYAGVITLIFRNPNNVGVYTIHVTMGLLVWLFIHEVVLQGCALFIREQNFLHGTTLPLSVYAWRLMMRSTIKTGFSTVAAIALVLYAGLHFHWSIVTLIFAIALLLFTALPTIIILATLCTRIRDLESLIVSFMRLAFFLTPIFWLPEGNQFRIIISQWNPFRYYLDIVREPLIHGGIPWNAWIICSLMSMSLWFSAMMILGICRKKVVFWV